MTTYAVGAVHGDFETLTQLLDRIGFDRTRDRLWFSGNLVNDGPDSLAVLRFVKDLGRQATAVLGTQELRLLAIAEGAWEQDQADRFEEILGTPDRTTLLKWLYQRPFLHHEADFTLLHAGIPAEWSLSQARTFAIEAESSLTMGNHKTFFENIAGASPSRWHAKHRGWKRLRFIVNALTRLGYCDDSGRFDFSDGQSFTALAEDIRPWYRQAGRAMAGHNIIFGNRLEPAPQDIPAIFPLNDDGDSLTAMKVSDARERITLPRR